MTKKKKLESPYIGHRAHLLSEDDQSSQIFRKVLNWEDLSDEEEQEFRAAFENKFGCNFKHFEREVENSKFERNPNYRWWRDVNSILTVIGSTATIIGVVTSALGAVALGNVATILGALVAIIGALAPYF